MTAAIYQGDTQPAPLAPHTYTARVTLPCCNNNNNLVIISLLIFHHFLATTAAGAVHHLIYIIAPCTLSTDAGRRVVRVMVMFVCQLLLCLTDNPEVIRSRMNSNLPVFAYINCTQPTPPPPPHHSQIVNCVPAMKGPSVQL